MPEIPFPNGFEGSKDLATSQKSLLNVFRTPTGILARPGIPQLNTTGGKTARGNFEWNGSMYQVVSNDLIKITNKETGAFSTVNSLITGSAPIKVAAGDAKIVILVPGEKTFTLDKSDVLVDITGNTNFVLFRSVAHIGGIFVYCPSTGEPIKFSNVGDPSTIQASSFFDAETAIDLNREVFVLNNILYVMGQKTTEAFRLTTALPVPFIRIPGALIDRGHIGGLLEYDNSFFFIGKKTNNVAGIFAIGPDASRFAQPGESSKGPKVSNERIDELLSTYTEAELEEAIPGRIIFDGYDIATFALRRDSFGFVNGNFFLLDTIINGESKPWSAGFILGFEGEYFSAFEDKIGKFTRSNTDYGSRITREIQQGAIDENGDWRTVHNMKLGISQGFNAGFTTPGSVAIQMSRDNILFGPHIFINLGIVGEYDRKLKWNPPGGLGRYLGYFAFKISTTADINMSADKLIADFSA